MISFNSVKNKITQWMDFKGFHPYKTIIGSFLRLISGLILWSLLWIVCFIVDLILLATSKIFITWIFLPWFLSILFLLFLITQTIKIIKHIFLSKIDTIKIVRSNLIALFIFFLIYYIPSCITHLQEIQGGIKTEYSEYKDCDSWTKKEGKGPLHTFQGQQYQIQVCAKEDSNLDSSFHRKVEEYKLRIMVFDESGQNLQALRFLKISTGIWGFTHIEFNEDSISFIDDSPQKEFIRPTSTPISMPPSILEWIFARFPEL